jgi:hypothetical protein
MTPKRRVREAMMLATPDRVPVMCQLSIGHYYLHSGIDPINIWYTSEGFADALIRLQREYRFDGILINLPGREFDYERHLQKIEESEKQKRIYWKNGDFTDFPADDLPHYHYGRTTAPVPPIDQIDPEKLYYVEPYDITGISYPYAWGFEDEPRPFDRFFPEYHGRTIALIKERVGTDISVHSEIFSPWTQLLELLGYENALMAIIDDPGKIKACLARLAEGAADLGKRQAALNVDAILISSAFAGGGFISRAQYEEFVAPYERVVIREIKTSHDIPVYTHTCGKIGDRLELMLGTGTNGIDTLDPPPLGNVELSEAKRILNGKAFIKGNIDPVNILLKGDRKTVRENVIRTITTGMQGGGYITSSACSVSPYTPQENIRLLASLADEYGVY